MGLRTSGVISNWENDLNRPDTDKLTALCRALGTTPNFLLGWADDEADVLSPEEHDLVADYRRLDAYGQKLVLTVMENERDRMKSQQQPTMFRMVARGGEDAAELGDPQLMTQLTSLFDAAFGHAAKAEEEDPTHGPA